MSMILYNYRYRGPHEYDKFIYNTFQLVNEMDLLEAKLLRGDYGVIQQEVQNLDDIIETLTGEDCKLQQQLVLLKQLEI